MLALELDRRFHAARTDAISLAAHPGYTDTNLQTGAAEMKGSGVEKMAHRRHQPRHRHAAVEGRAADARRRRRPRRPRRRLRRPDGLGRGLGHARPGRSASARARDAEMAARLVEACEALTGVALDPAAVQRSLRLVTWLRISACQRGSETSPVTVEWTSVISPELLRSTKTNSERPSPGMFSYVQTSNGAVSALNDCRSTPDGAPYWR